MSYCMIACYVILFVVFNSIALYYVILCYIVPSDIVFILLYIVSYYVIHRLIMYYCFILYDIMMYLVIHAVLSYSTMYCTVWYNMV